MLFRLFALQFQVGWKVRRECAKPCAGERIEQNFAQQAIVLAQHTPRNLHVALEGGARRILMFHHRSKHKGADKKNAQRIGHRFVVFAKRIFAKVKAQTTVEVAEENAPHVVTFVDDDGIFVVERTQIGKRGAKHGVG